MLDDLDRELERRGHGFVRYADDVTIYVRSERAGQRVMASITQFVEQRLKLRVNRRSRRSPGRRSGPFWGLASLRRGGQVKVRVGPQGPEAGQGPTARADRAHLGRLDGAADRARSTASRSDGRPTSRWPTRRRPFETLDEWLRRRLRQVRWKEWKRVRSQARNLVALGIPAGQGPRVGRLGQGILAHRGLRILNTRPAQRLLDQPRPAGFTRSLPPFPGREANRRMRTRMSGGVGGAGVSPAPTRFSGLARPFARLEAWHPEA